MSSRKFAKQQSEKKNIQSKNYGQTEKSREKPASADNSFIKSRNNKTDKFSGLKNKSFKTKEKQNRSLENTSESKTAKPFDKKAWRYKRYSLKYKLDQWKDLRKTQALNSYKKSMSKNASNEPSFHEKYYQFADEDEDIQEKNSETFQKETSDLWNDIASNKEKKESAGRKRKISFKGSGIDDEANQKQMEILNKKKEREDALKEYKRKKIEKFKKLNKKTKKGQPVMKGRLEVLLEEIQNMVKS